MENPRPETPWQSRNRIGWLFEEEEDFLLGKSPMDLEDVWEEE